MSVRWKAFILWPFEPCIWVINQITYKRTTRGRIPRILISHQGNILKGIENCSGAAHKVAILLWKQDLVTIFLYFNFKKIQFKTILVPYKKCVTEKRT